MADFYWHFRINYSPAVFTFINQSIRKGAFERVHMLVIIIQLREKIIISIRGHYCLENAATPAMLYLPDFHVQTVYKVNTKLNKLQ